MAFSWSHRKQTYRKGPGLGGWRRMPRTRRRSRHLFDRWPHVAERLRAAKHLALFLDFDGTLVPLRRRPEDVWLGDAARRLLGRLARHRRVALCIVSGRKLADVRRRAKLRGARYIGLHGWERNDNPPPAKEAQEILRRAKRRVVERLGNLSGIWVEDKGFIFVAHYRGAARSVVRQARAILRETLEPFESHLRVLKGKKVWEVLPREVEGKGPAVRALLAELPSPALPIYLGDDTTDESAFAALRQGITVRVGRPRQTKARYYVRDPDEVLQFLTSLESEIA